MVPQDSRPFRTPLGRARPSGRDYPLRRVLNAAIAVFVPVTLASISCAHDVRAPGDVFQSWSDYHGDPGRTHYSSLAQIDTTNVSGLQVAWTYSSGGLEPGVNTEMQHNPLIVDSVLYGTNPRLRLFKIDARTGREIWRLDSLAAGRLPVWFGRSRGLMRWVSPDGNDERIYFGLGPYLYAANARTG